VAYPFIPAKNYTKGRIAKVRVIVIHDMEAGEVKGTARSVAGRFGSDHAPQASAHYCVDRDEIIQCVRDEDTAWHAPGCNADGIGIEHAGMAKQSRRDWTDPYSARMLVRSAKLTATLCRKHGIPPVHLTNEELRAGKKGIVGHVQVSAVYKRSDHWDPGPNFPWDVYLTSVKAEYDALAGKVWTQEEAGRRGDGCRCGRVRVRRREGHLRSRPQASAEADAPPVGDGHQGPSAPPDPHRHPAATAPRDPRPTHPRPPPLRLHRGLREGPATSPPRHPHRVLRPHHPAEGQGGAGRRRPHRRWNCWAPHRSGHGIPLRREVVATTRMGVHDPEGATVFPAHDPPAHRHTGHSTP
jgi:N-acetyl-anhydromuramyl-L-alanine amidase AmpD